MLVFFRSKLAKVKMSQVPSLVAYALLVDRKTSESVQPHRQRARTVRTADEKINPNSPRPPPI